MSIHKFTSGANLLIVRGLVQAQQTTRARLAIDTGASLCQISSSVANSIGLDFSSPIRQVNLITGSGEVHAPVVYLPRLEILGKAARQLEVVIHDIPTDARLDGLLGLNFFRDYNFFLNYGKGILVIQAWTERSECHRVPKNFWLNFTQTIEVWRAMQ